FTTESLLRGDAGGVLMPLVRRDLLLESGGFDESLTSAADCDMWLRLSFATTMIGLPRPLLLCRAHPARISSDRGENARNWRRTLDKLAAARPEWIRATRWPFRRALGKERLRLGRERLASWDGSAAALREARRALLGSVGAYPFFLRAWLYLAWSALAPRAYG